MLGISIQACNTVRFARYVKRRTYADFFKTLNTLLMDLDPQNAASAQAACNLLRCLLAAGALACLEPLTSRLGLGPTFTLIAAFAAVCLVLLAIEVRRGQRW